ncbi:HD domain-containing protein [Nesterenkonia sp. AY15]|uniref:HD domain-containing protein n=1 Tax=Nesterenkonia sp. AY15 TaxID=2901139 RepID=UPI001F4CA7F4|nr:HD domain-containing protein [Nesterenkonia sp. AY15]MCH8570071.1 HD domain-containing protein [Nesterenkonia sp. AY15]
MSINQNYPQWAPSEPDTHTRDPRAEEFARSHPILPIPTGQDVETAPIAMTPSRGFTQLWNSVAPETRVRGNSVHLPLSVAYAERLCDAYPEADRELVLVSILLHDTGWAHVDESRILSEGFGGDWRKAAIRYEHEEQGCVVARRVLPPLGYGADFVEQVCQIIDGHDTRAVAYSLEDALVRDADRLWRFDTAGIALASSWFAMDTSTYCDRLEREIIPELLTEAGVQMARADFSRSSSLLRTEALR